MGEACDGSDVCIVEVCSVVAGGEENGVEAGVSVLQIAATMLPVCICRSRGLLAELTLAHKDRTVNCTACNPSTQLSEHVAPLPKSSGVHPRIGALYAYTHERGAGEARPSKLDKVKRAPDAVPTRKMRFARLSCCIARYLVMEMRAVADMLIIEVASRL